MQAFQSLTYSVTSKLFYMFLCLTSHFRQACQTVYESHAGHADQAGHAGQAHQAGHAGHADQAGHAGHADHAGHAGHADHAGHASHAGSAARMDNTFCKQFNSYRPLVVQYNTTPIPMPCSAFPNMHCLFALHYLFLKSEAL